MKIEGRNPVIETLRSNRKVIRVLLQKNINIDPKIAEILAKCQEKGIELIYKDKQSLDGISSTHSHQGVIAEVAETREPKLDEVINFEKINRLIYIRDANHTHNIGAIIRTAECAGYDAVILPPKIKITGDIIRAAMGATEHIPVLHYSLFQLIKDIKKLAFSVYAIERSDSAINYTDIDYSNNFLLIIGGEDKSLTNELFDKCDQTIKIPMHGKVNSLNMSVAAAIVIYQSIEEPISIDI